MPAPKPKSSSRQNSSYNPGSTQGKASYKPTRSTSFCPDPIREDPSDRSDQAPKTQIMKKPLRASPEPMNPDAPGQVLAEKAKKRKNPALTKK
ncbi:hypothetical protein BPOR_1094g00010 [Botrytis porri]|uniref:Uncharacterized protein n=1 Tax=Botrytis porri TaxID=87229 RepID=A0A4Z1K6L4_9HELO|nr:hypothetical protein BPOR_1094g00010 [Botrytis porri]